MPGRKVNVVYHAGCDAGDVRVWQSVRGELSAKQRLTDFQIKQAAPSLHSSDIASYLPLFSYKEFMVMNKSQIDWSKIFQGSLEQLQSAPPEILDVDLEHIVHELLKPDAPGVHCVPESILDAKNIVGNASTCATATATVTATATAAGFQVLPEFQATKLGDVVNQGLEYAPTWTVSECLDNWAKAQRQGTANGVVHRSVVLHPVPVPPTNAPTNGAFGSYGTFTSQAIAANASEMARKQAAKAARAARVQKRRQEKFRRGDSKGKRTQPSEVLIQSFSGHLPIQSTQMVAHGSQPKTDAKDRNEIRAIKNRESAARSRAKRVEYTAALEAQVEKLREQNKTLRGRVIALAPAPPDPHAGKLEGRPLRRTRTMPL